ncbi:MAG: tetratricopeptide repeat protein [Treponema sp.]|jgi:tetratricopeptide (TPR) repeat protein|nr:tetratricopeptide repeat protein [Treponema sp.]
MYTFDDPVSWYEAGVYHVARQEYDEAMKCFNDALAAYKPYFSVYFNRGIILDRYYRNYDGAIADYRTALDIKPEDDYLEVITKEKIAEVYKFIGLAYRQKDNYNAALENYNKSIELNPDNWSVFSNRGFLYDKMGKNALALADYIEAIYIKPDYAIAYNNRGIILERMGKYDEARDDYLDAIRLDPKFPEPYNNLGNIYCKQGNYKSAIQYYKIALKLNPNYTVARQNLNSIMGMD